MKPTTAVIDLDLFKYHAAAAGETRSVLVTHKTSNRAVEVNSRTEWYGDWRKKEGGKLAEINKSRTSPFMWDEFSYEDIQRPEPIENVLHTAKVMVEKDLKASGAESYLAFLGEGESFRTGKSTLLKYKDRDDNIKPVLLSEVTEYLRKKFKAEVVSDIECDDKVVMECFKHPERFALVEDKDFWGCPVNVWDRNQQERGIVNCNKFGHLFLDAKGKVRGEGRMHFYWQVCSEDNTDNYKANCFSDKKWAAKGAYNALVNCKSDKEAFEKMKEIFLSLYPEPKVVQGWRGDSILIDWQYVLTECFHMARMLRFDGDEVDPIQVMHKMGIQV